MVLEGRDWKQQGYWMFSSFAFSEMFIYPEHLVWLCTFSLLENRYLACIFSPLKSLLEEKQTVCLMEMKAGEVFQKPQ